MKKTICKKCHKITLGSIHHINGNSKNNKPENLVKLCYKCHDFIQGICDKCNTQKSCQNIKFINCWRFDDALPPIHFEPKQELIKESKNEIDKKEVIARQCIICRMWFAAHKNVQYADWWCDSCLEKLIIKQTPDKWEILQEWKRSIGI